ncbi:hypothetical protein CRD60_03065 [Bifidobacterium aemilianum]|uniref:Alcohol dehydrogenase-like N-terminal domain-containing protein n=1 Tax=Bifidobacterium aemilianum TaxID=2493120 RepID=A0A366K973_9BIFI|nr:hypothetical protein CRD60_03065 [Bifidobacterium aemilianum]
MVEQVGTGVSDFKPGDQVVIGFTSCGGCKYCRKGLTGACERFPELNRAGP